MIARTGRLLLVFAIGMAAWWLTPLLSGPTGGDRSIAATAGQAIPKSCHDANPAWSEVAVDLRAAAPPIAPGRVFRLSDGTIAVLVVVTAANGDGRATTFDFSASLRVAAVIVRAGSDGAYVPFVPPVRNGSGLSAPQQASIDAISFCYRIQVPNPPPPGATPALSSPTPETLPTTAAETPPATATPTPESFDIGAVQTARALATDAAGARASAAAVATVAAAGEATRNAEATAAEATIAALATAQAKQNASAAAQATSAAATATAEAVGRAAVQATASAEIAAAQATAATLATADAARQTELAESRAAQTQAAATIAALQSTAEAPSPTPISTPTPASTPTPTESLLYGVPGTEGFAAWSVPPGWTVSAGELVADGSKFQGYAQPAHAVDRNDYAVEAEIKIDEQPACAANFGIVVRGSETGYYAGGVEWVCNAGASARLWALNTLLGQQPVSVDQGWHTYRVAVNGDHLTYSIDGTVVLEATDSRYATGGQVALWSNGVKLEVRTFRVLVKP